MQTTFHRNAVLKIPRRYDARRDFLIQNYMEEIDEKLSDHNRKFDHVLRVMPPQYHVEGQGAQILPNDNLGLGASSFDLILHIGALHAQNDPVGQLIQSRMALKPDGVLIAAFLGGETLRELREAMMEAEIEVYAGASQRVAPMIDIRDAGNLLTRAGFALPVADLWSVKAEYESLPALLKDLRKLGISNPLDIKPRSGDRAFYRAVERIYREKFLCESGRLCASFDLIFLTGYAPSDNQPKPLKPGSISTPLFEAIERTKT